MTDFVKRTLDIYIQHYPNVKLWAGISTNNASSKALAHKLGFIENEAYTDSEKHWCAMILK